MQLMRETSRKSRRIRRPVHNFALRHRPWQIQPFLMAPVLPGETMRNLLLQSRCVTDPIQNRLIGWWLEHYFFYVKLRDLDDRENFETMLLDPESTAISSDTASSNVQYYQGHTAYNFCGEMLKRVTEEYFRQDDETWNTNLINGLPAASVNKQDVLDSVINDTDYATDISEEESITVGGDDSFTGQEIHDLMQKWHWQREHGIQDMDFEDFLRTYGVNVPKKDDEEYDQKPELIRFVRNWQYPSNTIDPSDGSAASAVSWSVQERADKDRYFTEPGFVFGVTVVRPKVYYKNQVSSFIYLMDEAKKWLPAMLQDDPFLGMVQRSATTAPLSSNTDAYWVDLRDLLMYGDQFVNFALTATDAGLVALPTAGLEKRYPASTDADNMFVDTTAGAGQVEQDGVVSLMIASRQQDKSATV